MYNKELLRHVLCQMEEAARKVLTRFEPVTSVGGFTDTSAGMEKLDSICMLLIAIGESLKNVDKITHHQLLPQYPQIDWKGAKGMRDIISHHYFDIDAEEIYWVCQHNIKPLADMIRVIINDIDSE
ncbi:MAG: DUF86 domain-containing protein [Desulfuromonadaceae bacterium]|nr:DUF86 domain-containing protein [Desulfuromonadaceae bacterium]